MASQLTAEGFWDLVQAILPFYIILFIAYGLARKGMLSTIHGQGLARWTSLVGIPIYVGHMLAFNDPYQINLRLVAADAMQKATVLIIAAFWWRFSKSANIDGIITFFMLATLSNLVLVGPALFEPLHGGASQVSVATLIILQCALWYNLCIFLFETRVVLKELAVAETAQTVKSLSGDLEKQVYYKPATVHILGTSPSQGGGLDPEGLNYGDSKMLSSARLQRTASAPARVSVSIARASLFPALFHREAQVADVVGEGDEEYIPGPNKLANGSNKAVREVSSDGHTVGVTDHDHDFDGQLVIRAGAATVDAQASRAQKLTYAKIIAIKVLGRVRYAPLTYTSIIGFAYSLMASKWDWDMPYPIRRSLDLVANGAIAISVVVMALTWSDSGRLISCGVKKMTYGFLIRFLIGPVIMVGCSYACGLRGIALEFGVLQAALPVGLVSFVLAKEYNLEIEVFSTAVITQLVVFLPVVTLYYFMLQPLGT